MSAVRMVAYGVLELKPKEIEPPKFFFVNSLANDAELERRRAEDFERDQLRKLVNDELRRYGLLLARTIVPKGQGWRTKSNACVLYGQLQGPAGFGRRDVLAEGDFKYCCECAAKILDRLDAAQVPDAATGHD